MVAEEVVVSLSGGAPWGFRLQGGAEHHKPLQVAKVRRRSKACRAGLKEDDELVAIDDHMCTELSHAQAMNLIDAQRATLNLRVKRAPTGLHCSSHSGRSVSPRSSVRVLSPPVAPLSSHRPSVLSPTGGPRGITSPPDSEAYYGETDSDADTQPHTHRRQRRTPPHARSPGRYDNHEEEETSEMSGYESAPDGGLSLQGQWEQPRPGECLPGVPRRELVYQPPQTEWATPVHTPHTLTPHTLTPTPDQGLVEAEGEGDSGFQEAGGCVGMTCPPLVSPERAKEALMLGSGRQLVPMVGPQQSPISDELSTTYMDKARQAKLQRGESVVEKQVKEARTKCRSIASLLTDAPNPNSKGVLMFKKRRQRAKKYTLTCFGKAESDRGGETEGETGGETEEEGGSSILSGSELDEEGFSASFDPTWDSGYLDLLDRRSSACPSTTPTTPTTPTANHNPGLDTSTYQIPGLGTSVNQTSELEGPGLVGSAYQSSWLESSSIKQPINAHPAPNPASMSPPAVALTNGGTVAVSRASVVLNPPSQTPLPNQNGQHSSPSLSPNPNPNPVLNSEYNPSNSLSPNPSSVLNRTARPFTPGPASARASVTSVVFRPPQPKPATVTTATKPVAAVSMVTIAPSRQSSGPDARRAVSSTSLYIPPRNSNNSSAVTPPSVHSPPSALSPPSSSSSSAPFSQPPAHPPPFSPQNSVHASPFCPPSTPFSPSAAPSLSPAAQGPPLYQSPAQPFSPAVPQTHPFPSPPGPNYPPVSPGMSVPPFSPPQPPALAQVYNQAQPSPPHPHPHPLLTQPQPSPPHPHPHPPHPLLTQPQPSPPHPHPPHPLLTQPQLQPQPPPPPPSCSPYINMTGAAAVATPLPPQPPASDSLATREQRISVPASRTGILQEARRRGNKKPMFSAVQNKKDISPNPALLSMLQNMDDQAVKGSAGHGGSAGVGAGGEVGHESGPEEDWLRLGAEACNFMQNQRGPRPPPVAPKPQAPQVPQLAGKGGQLFARRQSRMDRYVVERSPSVAAAPYSPAQTREPSPTPSLPATWKYSSNIRAPPPINYNPLVSPSCPPKAQKTQKPEVAKAGSKAAGKAGMKPLDIMSHQPYQLNSTLFSYGGGAPKNTSTYQQQQGMTGGFQQGPMKTARVCEVKRFSTPPPTATGPTLKVIAPRSATTLGEPLWRSDVTSPPPPPASAPYQPYQPQPQWAASTLSPQPPPAPTAPLPQLPTFSSGPLPAPTFSHLPPPSTAQANKQFKSAPDLSPRAPAAASQPASNSTQQIRVPRPRFSTSNLGLQPCVWRPGSNMH